MAPRLTLQFHSPLRTLSPRLHRFFYNCRAFHDAKAELLTSDVNGTLQSHKLNIFIGDPHEAYIIIDTDVGFAMKSGIAKQAGLSPGTDQDKVPLTFFHDSRHFSHGTVQYPRIIINQDLPHQNTSNTSPATLWLWGATHSITLDGTPEHKFEESCRESHGRLKGALEILKHT